MSIFDFNRDGKVSFWERLWADEMIRRAIRAQQEEEEAEFSAPIRRSTYRWQDYCEDGSLYGLNPEDFDSKEEYESALAYEKFGWQDECEEGDEFDISPYDYNTRQEYEEALEEAKEDQIDEDDFIFQLPDRQYEAAVLMQRLEEGTAHISKARSAETEWERCRFILANIDPLAKYLTIKDGFLYNQAVQDRFELPVECPEDDTDLGKLVWAVAKINPALAVEIWVWCVKTFSPYKMYMAEKTWQLCCGVLVHFKEDSEETYRRIILELAQNAEFRKEVLEENPHFPFGSGWYMAQAFEWGMYAEAQIIFDAASRNPKAEEGDFKYMVEDILFACNDVESTERMVQFEERILPLIIGAQNPLLRAMAPKVQKEVEDYMEFMNSDWR